MRWGLTAVFIAVLAIVVLGWAGPAGAVSISCDFTAASTSTPSSVDFTCDSLTVTATGQSSVTNFLSKNGTDELVHWDSNGLGVWSSSCADSTPGCENASFSIEVDEQGVTETLFLQFSPIPVTLDSVDFNLFNSSDKFRLYVDGTLIVSSATIANVDDAGGLGIVDIGSLVGFSVTGTVFAFTLPPSAPGQESSYKVGALTFDPIPEPATVLLLGGGLLGLLGLRRRRFLG